MGITEINIHRINPQLFKLKRKIPPNPLCERGQSKEKSLGWVSAWLWAGAICNAPTKEQIRPHPNPLLVKEREVRGKKIRPLFTHYSVLGSASPLIRQGH